MAIDYEGDFDFSGLNANLAAALPEALQAGMDIVKERAVELVPKETEHLADSAKVSMVGNAAALTFDGPYANVQHERLDYKHPNGGVPKYEELALAEKGDEALAEVAKRLRESWQ